MPIIDMPGNNLGILGVAVVYRYAGKPNEKISDGEEAGNDCD
jgi:hypothetical protein